SMQLSLLLYSWTNHCTSACFVQVFSRADLHVCRDTPRHAVGMNVCICLDVTHDEHTEADQPEPRSSGPHPQRPGEIPAQQGPHMGTGQRRPRPSNRGPRLSGNTEEVVPMTTDTITKSQPVGLTGGVGYRQRIQEWCFDN